MKKRVVTGECEHCKPQVLYECPKFRAELTKRGMSWVLDNDVTPLQAMEEWQNYQDKLKKEHEY